MKQITVVYGNLFDYLQPGDAMVHGCNAQGVMGSGIALEVKNRYPSAFQAYRRQEEIYNLGLGDVIPYYDPKDQVWILNAVTQNLYGRDKKRYVSYDAVAECFGKIAEQNTKFRRLLFPMLGAGLGGGDWDIIQQIIKSEMKGCDTPLILVEFR